MWIGIITLFPEMFSVLQHSIPGRAQKHGLLTLNFWNPRDYTQDKHHTVDDRPYGGGPGMVMKAQPLSEAVRAAKAVANTDTKIIYVSPQGRRLDQAGVAELAKRQTMIMVAGRYEGIDERFIATEVDEEWSIGDYVLSGGELAAMVMIDAITRLIPGALGDADSALQDSFCNGLLDYPHYTRPEQVANISVPSVLMSGDHEAIRRWRLKQALGRTWQRRPDLLEQSNLNDEQQLLLAEFIREQT